jgi:hypothetical protein
MGRRFEARPAPGGRGVYGGTAPTCTRPRDRETRRDSTLQNFAPASPPAPEKKRKVTKLREMRGAAIAEDEMPIILANGQGLALAAGGYASSSSDVV